MHKQHTNTASTAQTSSFCRPKQWNFLLRCALAALLVLSVSLTGTANLHTAVPTAAVAEREGTTATAAAATTSLRSDAPSASILSAATSKTGNSTAARTTIPNAGTYQAIYCQMRSLYDRRLESNATAANATRKAAANATRASRANIPSGGAPMDAMAQSEEMQGTRDYSDTNIQVAGVQEADILKTDGRYLYALANNRLRIVELNNGQPRICSSIALASSESDARTGHVRCNSNTLELYVTGNRLVLLRQEERYTLTAAKTEAAKTGAAGTAAADTAGAPTAAVTDGCCVDYAYSGSDVRTYAQIYDITDRSHPKVCGELGQSGYYLSSRMVGAYLYIVTQHASVCEPKPDDPTTFVPSLYRGETQSSVPPASVLLTIQPQSTQYLVITGMDTAAPSRHVSSQSLLDGGNTLYASLEHLYVAKIHGTYNEISTSNGISASYEETTRLYKLRMAKGQVKYVATGSVKGHLLNQFSMDEYNGYLRLVTTTNGSTTGNHLWVLNAQLQPAGSLTDLAAGERVYSVRFDGETAYFVTFRQVDPLFTVSLTDPQKPVLQSALKIPGFSEYLHVYGDGLLFGLGRDADPATGRSGGLKLSMFDVSDPANVTEAHKLLLEMAYSWTEASYNHKAILIAPERHLIAFPVIGSYSAYCLFGYSPESGFYSRGEIRLPESMNGYGGTGQLRGLYSGEYLYVVTPNRVSAYHLTDLKPAGSVLLPM